MDAAYLYAAIAKGAPAKRRLAAVWNRPLTILLDRTRHPSPRRLPAPSRLGCGGLRASPERQAGTLGSAREDMAGPVHGERRDLAAIILRNTLAATAGAWFARITNFLFIIYVVRLLGEVELGRYATVVAFVGLFSVFSELGLAQYVERSIAQDRSRAQDMFWDLIALRAILAIAGVAGITLGAFVAYDRELILGVFIFSLTFLLSAFLVPATIVLTANERFDFSTFLNLIGQIGTVAVGVLLLKLGLGFYALLLTGFVTMPLQIAAAIWLIRRAGVGPLPRRIQPRSWPTMIRAGLPFGLISLALTFNFNVDTVILGYFRGDAEVGWYNAAYRLVFNVTGIAGGFMAVMTPSLAREHLLDPERVRQWVQTSLRWMVTIAIPAGVGMSLLAPRIIGLLYGRNYEPAAPTLALIAWDIPLVLLLAFLGNVTAATGLERSSARIYLVSAGLNLALNLAFIPIYGMIAAAAVTVGTDLLSVAMYLILLRQSVPVPALARVLIRVSGAALVMGAVLMLTDALPLFALIIVGGGLYLLIAVCLRLLDVQTLLALGRRLLGSLQRAS